MINSVQWVNFLLFYLKLLINFMYGIIATPYPQISYYPPTPLRLLPPHICFLSDHPGPKRWNIFLSLLELVPFILQL